MAGFWSEKDRFNLNATPTIDNTDMEPWSRPQIESLRGALVQAALSHEKKPDWEAIAKMITAETQARIANGTNVRGDKMQGRSAKAVKDHAVKDYTFLLDDAYLDCEEFEVKVKDLEKKVKRLEGDLHATEEETDALETERKEAKEEVKAKNREIRRLKDELDDAQEAITAKDREIQRLAGPTKTIQKMRRASP